MEKKGLRGDVSWRLLCPLLLQVEVANLQVGLKDLRSRDQPLGMVVKEQSPQPARSSLDRPPGITPGQRK